MLTVLTVMIILAVAYAQMREGLYTGLCMVINIVIAGLLAFGFFEPIADWLEPTLQGGFLAGYEDFLALVGVFAIALIILRSITNALAPDMLDFPANAQYAGAGFGLVSGYFLAGFLICAMETLPWSENFYDFKPRGPGETGTRSIFPPDRVWLAMMRYAGANPLAWEEAPGEGDTPYDRYLTFDRYGTFEVRYQRYRRFGENRPQELSDGQRYIYRGELDRELHKP
jgi:colicin V production protein